MSTPRGIRNNNPGNIERNAANKWQGRMPREQMTPEQRAEKRFEVFATPAWGIRAMCVLLINYFDRHNCHTVRQIINRWAPPVENNTDAYVAAVAIAVGVAPDTWINVHEYRRLHPLVLSIIHHENGQQPYSPETIEEGLRLAGVVSPEATPLIAPTKAVDTAVAAAATAGGAVAVAEVAQQVSTAIAPVLPAVQQINTVAQSTSALPEWLRAAVTLVVVVAAGASLYAWWKLRRARKAVAP